MAYHCQLKEQPSQPALSVRTRAAVQELPALFEKTYGAIMQYLDEVGEQPTGMPFAAYYNLDMRNLDVEIGFPVARELPGKGNVQPSQFPGGKLASVMHVGQYDQVEPAYDALMLWVNEHGYETTGVAYEIYYSGPETPPEEIRTEIMFPLK